MRKICCFIVSALLLSNVGFAVAKNNKHFDEQNSKQQERFEKMAKKLNLSNDQVSKMESLKKENKEKMKQIIDQIREKDKEIDAELVKENYDRAKVNSLLQEIRNLSADIAQIRIDGKIKVRSILTREQFEKLKQNKQAKNKKAKKN